jgi:peptidoglycan/LPS O-acetylase OafA/YrhL
MHRTIDAGPALLALGGLLLLIGLFLPWYDGESAWHSFESLDLVLAALAVGALAVGAGRIGAEDSRVGLAFAVAALVVVAVQLIDPPPLVGQHAKLDTGAWFALASSLLMLTGAAQTIARFTVSVDVRSRERRRRVAVADRRAPDETATTTTDAAASSRRPVRLMTEDDGQRTEAMPAVSDPDEDTGQ